MTLNSVEKLYGVLSSLNQNAMPLRLAYKFTKFSSKIEEDYNFYIEKTREIVMKYAEKDEEGKIIPNDQGNVTIKKDHIPQAEKELSELARIEVNNPEITFTLEELESLEIKPYDLQYLIPFIEE
jgi:hypothetical protein